MRGRIQKKKSPTRTSIEISKNFKSKQLNGNNDELKGILHLKKWNALARECHSFDSLIGNRENIPKFKRSREKVYFKLSYELWEKVKGRKGTFKLNEIIDTNEFHRSKAIRIIRRWNQRVR
jgi:hypothetical protein